VRGSATQVLQGASNIVGFPTSQPENSSSSGWPQDCMICVPGSHLSYRCV